MTTIADAGLLNHGISIDSAWGDYDNDGDLDVAIWPEAQRMLENAPELEAKELFEHLCGVLGEAAIGSLVGEWSGAMQPCKWTVAGLRRLLGLEQPPTVPDPSDCSPSGWQDPGRR